MIRGWAGIGGSTVRWVGSGSAALAGVGKGEAAQYGRRAANRAKMRTWVAPGN